MAKNGKNRLAILAIFRCHRTDVNLSMKPILVLPAPKALETPKLVF
jgi:hypothetical protein